MKNRSFIGIIMMALIFTGSGAGSAAGTGPKVQAGQYDQEQITPLVVQLMSGPFLAKLSDGTYCLNYELIVMNAAKSAVTVENIDVIDPASADRKIGGLGKEEILGKTYLPGAGEPTATLGPGQSGYIRIDLTFSSKAEVPGKIEHLIALTVEKPYGGLPAGIVERVAASGVVSAEKIVISPPVKGDNWIAVAVGKDSYHRKTVMPINGVWYAPERWAVDWIQLAAENKLFTGDASKNENYPQYGKDIVAVRDGVIESVRTDMADETAGKLPENITIGDAAGNYIVQDIGGGYYALYAHLKPGSIKVKKGQKVRRGQVIASLGNSGNSSGPHLHFHVIEGKLPLGSNGVPYVIDGFVIKGEAVSADFLETEFEKGETVKIAEVKGPGRRQKEMPHNLAVVEFSR